uniref:Uncharacterized protein n=1 Tax=Pararge aegeria TaxID=116150 RepID=S4NL47_9NEOP
MSNSGRLSAYIMKLNIFFQLQKLFARLRNVVQFAKTVACTSYKRKRTAYPKAAITHIKDFMPLFIIRLLARHDFKIINQSA